MADDTKSVRDTGATAPQDDIVLPFRTVRSGVVGRIVRLGSVVDTILSRHDNPEPVSRVLGEALALGALLGASMKPESRLTLQTKGDGPLSFIVVNYEMPAAGDGRTGRMRGYASVAKDRWQAFATGHALADKSAVDEGSLLGAGLLALTIDPGGSQPSYQGIVALEEKPLEAAALTYFEQSEQLPTLLRLVVARHFTAGQNGAPGKWSWRAGGLLVQHVTAEHAISAANDDDDPDGGLAGARDDDWNRVRMLAETVEAHELLDPTLSSERLLYRLFHEEGVTVTPAHRLSEYCRCSKERVSAMMQSFDASDIADMREADGAITVTCEFCNTKYRLEPGETV